MGGDRREGWEGGGDERSGAAAASVGMYVLVLYCTGISRTLSLFFLLSLSLLTLFS